jgi:hypothetical protein
MERKKENHSGQRETWLDHFITKKRQQETSFQSLTTQNRRISEDYGERVEQKGEIDYHNNDNDRDAG